MLVRIGFACCCLAVLGCTGSAVPEPAEQAGTKTEVPSAPSDPEPVDDSVQAARPKVPAGPNARERFDHVIATGTEYYTGGPQQARPPDGRLEPGTSVRVADKAGSYLLVETAGGISGYVAADAVRAVGEAGNANGQAMQALVLANNAFSLDIYKRLAQRESGNLFLSPLNISMAFAMVYAGARGETASQIADVLQFAPSQTDVHLGYAALQEALQNQNGQGNYQLSLANRLWGQQSYVFSQDFTQLSRRYYGAELGQVDFRARPDEARSTINKWVMQQTAGRIEDLLPEGSVDMNTLLVLTSAIYFKGDWESAFLPHATRGAPFHLTANDQVDVPTMFQEERFEHAEIEGLDLLKLPYKDEEQLSLIVLLPTKHDGLADLERELSHRQLTSWLEKLEPRQVQVYLPKFKSTSQFDLKSTLSDMGMTAVFDPERANLSGISEQDELVLSAAVHQAFVQVDEEGTEAAAATGAVVGVTSAPADTPVVFRADHPFLYLIYHEQTGGILFLGRLADPRS